jgi:hypothetical protein
MELEARGSKMIQSLPLPPSNGNRSRLGSRTFTWRHAHSRQVGWLCRLGNG